MGIRVAERGTAAGGDVVVVMARGAGRRFGGAKPLALVGGDPRPLVRRVADLYAAALDAPLLIVTTADLREAVSAAVAELPAATVLGAAGGGDTARTLGLAWEWIAVQAPLCARVWAHPVDVPRVAARTLGQLARVAAARPACVVRPAWGGRPGHPVVVPATMLAGLAVAARAADGPWREVLAAAVTAGRAAPPLAVDVADPGVVLDHDEPDGRDGESGGEATTRKGGR